MFLCSLLSAAHIWPGLLSGKVFKSYFVHGLICFLVDEMECNGILWTWLGWVNINEMDGICCVLGGNFEA